MDSLWSEVSIWRIESTELETDLRIMEMDIQEMPVNLSSNNGRLLRSGFHHVNVMLKWSLISWCLGSEPELGSVLVVRGDWASFLLRALE